VDLDRSQKPVRQVVPISADSVPAAQIHIVTGQNLGFADWRTPCGHTRHHRSQRQNSHPSLAVGETGVPGLRKRAPMYALIAWTLLSTL
jgi:hypothetical protein